MHAGSSPPNWDRTASLSARRASDEIREHPAQQPEAEPVDLRRHADGVEPKAHRRHDQEGAIDHRTRPLSELTAWRQSYIALVERYAVHVVVVPPMAAPVEQSPQSRVSPLTKLMGALAAPAAVVHSFCVAPAMVQVSVVFAPFCRSV